MQKAKPAKSQEAEPQKETTGYAVVDSLLEKAKAKTDAAEQNQNKTTEHTLAH